MKKFLLKIEEIWITSTFAEEGIYEADRLPDQGYLIHEPACRQES